MIAPDSSPPDPHRHARGVKIPAGVVTALVLAGAAGGAWFVWEELFATHTVDASLYESNDTPEAMVRARFFDTPTTNPMGDITFRADGTGDLRVAGAFCRFAKNGANLEATLIYQDTRFVPFEDRQANTARFMAMMNKNAATSANVTADQFDKLRPLVPPTNIPAAAADRTKLVDLWTQYGAADDAGKPSIAAALEAEFRRVAAAGLDPATLAYTDYALKIRAILTPQQINELRPQRGGFGGGRPRQGLGPTTR